MDVALMYRHSKSFRRKIGFYLFFKAGDYCSVHLTVTSILLSVYQQNLCNCTFATFIAKIIAVDILSVEIFQVRFIPKIDLLESRKREGLISLKNKGTFMLCISKKSVPA